MSINFPEELDALLPTGINWKSSKHRMLATLLICGNKKFDSKEKVLQCMGWLNELTARELNGLKDERLRELGILGSKSLFWK